MSLVVHYLDIDHPQIDQSDERLDLALVVCVSTALDGYVNATRLQITCQACYERCVQQGLTTRKRYATATFLIISKITQKDIQQLFHRIFLPVTLSGLRRADGQTLAAGDTVLNIRYYVRAIQ